MTGQSIDCRLDEGQLNRLGIRRRDVLDAVSGDQP
jgi:hypothetical protein